MGELSRAHSTATNWHEACYVALSPVPHHDDHLRQGGRSIPGFHVGTPHRMERPAKICRREALIPGDLLPDCPPGKHHGTVIKVLQDEAGRSTTVHIKMSDIGPLQKRLQIQVPLEKVLPYLLPKKEKPRRPRGECAAPAKRTAVAKLKDCTAKRLKKPQPLITPLKGPELSDFMKKLEGAVSAEHPPGTRVWTKVAGSGRFPAVTWSFAACKRKDMGALITAYREGLVCVRYYGEHSTMWVRDEDLEPPPDDESELQRQFKNWGRQRNKMRMVELALDEMLGTHAEPDKELRRMVMLYDQYLQTREALDNCYLCRELGARLECCVCDRLFHPLCLREPVVSEEELLDSCQGRWACPCCGEDNKVREEAEGGEDDDRDEEWGHSPDKKQERLGLTPDWLIEAAAFHVFQLERPHARRPYIPGLLDPCTNSKLAPNIPAELLYDKRDNGLKLSNSWSGYYVLLNPDYSAQIQWRFVNRCIDEVENGQVPAAVLICRNSTDTAYFQRLRPYPRVMLRRMSARFKDYDKTPIGFGIAVFCIAKIDCRQLYERFFDALEPMGEPNVPVDRTFVQSEEYVHLLERLKDYAAVHHRDHWVQCSSCERWRIVGYEAALQLGDDDEWTCTMLDPPYSSCDTPLTKRELLGGRYAAGGADNLADRGVHDEEGSLGEEEGGPGVKEEGEGEAAGKGSLEQQHDGAEGVIKLRDSPEAAATAVEEKSERSPGLTSQQAVGWGSHALVAAPACEQPGGICGRGGVPASTDASAAVADAQHLTACKRQQQPQVMPHQAVWPVLGGLPGAHAAVPRFMLPPSLAAGIPPTSPLLAAWRPALAAAAAAAAAAAGAAARPRGQVEVGRAVGQLGPPGFLGLPPGLMLASAAAARPLGTVGPAGVGQSLRLPACVPPFLPFPFFPVQPTSAAAAAAAAADARSVAAASALRAESGKPGVPDGGTRTTLVAQVTSPLQGPSGSLGALEPPASAKRDADPSALPPPAAPAAAAAARATASGGEQGGSRASAEGMQVLHSGPSGPQQVLPTHPPGQQGEGSGGKKSEDRSADMDAVASLPTGPSLLRTPTPCTTTGAKLCTSPLDTSDGEQQQQHQGQQEGMAKGEAWVGLPPTAETEEKMAGVEEGLVESSSGKGGLAAMDARLTAPDPSPGSLAPPPCPAEQGPTAGTAPPPATKNSNSHAAVQTPEEGPPPSAAALPVPLPRAVDVVCERTLRELVALPPRNITLDREGAGDSGQVLTALELARQARIAANRAYLAGLGLGPKALHDGKVEPLPPDDPVVLQAARELAMQAAAEEARRQLTRMRQRYEAARRRRAKLEPALLRQLRELAEQESEAQRELAAAEAAAAELGGEEGGSCGLGRLGMPQDVAVRCTEKAGVVMEGAAGEMVKGAAAVLAKRADEGRDGVFELCGEAVEEGAVEDAPMGEGGLGTEVRPQLVEIGVVV